MRLRHTLSKLPDFTLFDSTEQEYPEPEWYRFEDCEIGAWVEDTSLVIGYLCRDSRQDNMKTVENPKPSGFLNRFVETTEIIATVHGLDRVVIDNVVNAFLPDALERRGFQTLRLNQGYENEYKIDCIKKLP